MSISINKKKRNRFIFLFFMIFAILIIPLSACGTQSLARTESTATSEIEEIVIGGPPEPPAGIERPGVDNLGGLQKIAEDGSSLYFYQNGERISLTPSLNWITIRFKTENLNDQEATLQNIAAFAFIDQRTLLTETGILLLPLQSGISRETLITNINLMRVNSDIYSQVNPVFIIDGVEKGITDQIIVRFSEEKNLEEINSINAEMGTSINSTQDPNANTYVLIIDIDSIYDAVSMANQYYEKGYAVEASPLFVDITK